MRRVRNGSIEVRMADSATVCVVIAAKNASPTIARAIRSALRERRVAEVVVVDDGSTDGTAETSRAADDGSGRLRVLSLDTNRGPAFARNHAIANSTAPMIAKWLAPMRFSASAWRKTGSTVLNVASAMA